MASGDMHDAIAIRSFAPSMGIAIAISTTFGIPFYLTGLTAMTIPLAGLLLSPDLDTRSNAYWAWGFPLCLYWLPYRIVMKHRGMSHWPIVGSLGRLLYLLTPWFIILYLVGGWSIIPLWVISRSDELFSIWVGCEVAAILHLFADTGLFKVGHKLYRRLSD